MRVGYLKPGQLQFQENESIQSVTLHIPFTNLSVLAMAVVPQPSHLSLSLSVPSGLTLQSPSHEMDSDQIDEPSVCFLHQLWNLKLVIETGGLCDYGGYEGEVSFEGEERPRAVRNASRH